MLAVDALPATDDASLLDRVQFDVLSDTILIAVPGVPDGDACYYTLRLASDMVRALIYNMGLVVRGAIVRGKHFHCPGKGILLGPAFVRAYEIGEGKARYPRILIANEVVADAAKIRQQSSGHPGETNLTLRRPFTLACILADDDGLKFLHYLPVGIRSRSVTSPKPPSRIAKGARLCGDTVN